MSAAVRRAEVAVVGAGIVGLAHAFAAARRGRRVVVFERDTRALGASVRNFGLVWPIGQRTDAYELGLRSRETWLQLARDAGFWARRSGSLVIARLPEELAVLREFLADHPAAVRAGCALLTPEQVTARSPVVRRQGLLGGLWSPTEVNVDPRRAIPAIAAHLRERYGVRFEFGTTVLGVDLPEVHTSNGRWACDRAVICSGAEWAGLFPAEHAGAKLRRCKLQMLRTVPQPAGWTLGPALCSGLSLLHYEAFAGLPALSDLRDRLDHDYPAQRRHGIHVLVSGTERGELSIGDSHAYEWGSTDPFLDESAYQAVLDYLDEFVELPDRRVAQRWCGVYASPTGGSGPVCMDPAPGVTIVNGLGGAGMTLSFALAEQTLFDGEEAPATP